MHVFFITSPSLTYRTQNQIIMKFYTLKNAMSKFRHNEFTLLSIHITVCVKPNHIDTT
jgi:hypothetical protein